MRHLDLFSGIGGFALAASWVWGDEHEIVSFCEIEPFAKKVLKKHWPDVPIISDIRDVTNDKIQGPVDLLTGGFPCQPFSCAGKQRGKDDDRYLWPEMLRVIQEAQPRFIIGENVSNIEAIDNGMVVEQIQIDLENIGYKVCPPFEIPACSVNASHRRGRYWFLAYSNSIISENAQKRQNKIRLPFSLDAQIFRVWKHRSPILGDDNGIPNRVDRLKGLGNAIVPQVVVPIMQAIKDLMDIEELKQ